MTNATNLNFPTFFSFLFLLTGCINPIELPIRDADRALVVEGFVTNEPGPYTVRLSRSADFEGVSFGSGGIIDPESDAQVVLRDEDGFLVPFNEVRNGYYQTPPDFQAEIGKTYSLLIITLDGEEFLSAPVTIPQGADIDNIVTRFERKVSNSEFDFTTGVNVFVEFQDDPDENNFYLSYTSNGVFPWTAHPELASINPYFPCPTGQTVECFRYERDYFQPAFVDATRCYVPEARPFDFILNTDLLQNGSEITTLAAFIEDDGKRFEFSYRVRINFMTISAEAFGFYNRLASQLSIEGDIFDPPPAEILSNIINIGETRGEAIGFFGAYYASSEQIYIERDFLDIKQDKVQWAGECINLDSSTVVRPLDWEGSSW